MSTITRFIKPVGKSRKKDNSSTTSYKLIYFNFQWLAEPIRYLLCYVGEEFEDVRIDWGKWEKGDGDIDKTVYNYAKLPILEVKETKCNDKLGCVDDNTIHQSAPSSVLSIGQSFAILRYLGKKYNLVGRNLAEEAKCDEISDCVKDILKEVEELFTDDKQKMEELRTKIMTLTIPRYFNVFEKDLKVKMTKIAGKQEQANGKPNVSSENDKITMLPLVGDKLTWLDFQFAHYSELFEKFLKIKRGKEEGGDLQDAEKLFDSYPTIREHHKWVFGLDGVKEWRESRPVTEY